MMRSITVGLAAMTLVAGAAAQLNGPAPLAWRWYQSTTVSPTAPPTVVGDTVYYSLGSRVFRLDRSSGNLRWRFPAVDPIEGAFRSSPLLVGNTLVAVGDNQIIYGIDPTDGSLKWTYNTPGKVISQPVMVGKMLVAAQADNKLVAIYPDTGEAAWADPLTVFDGIIGSLAANGDDVLVFTSRAQELLSINTATRKTTWKCSFAQLEPTVSALVANGAIYVVSGPFLSALNPTNGRPKWQGDSRLSQLTFAPASSDSCVLAVSNDGKAVAFDFNGKLLTKTPLDLGSVPTMRPTCVGSKFVVLTANGAINLIDPAYKPPTLPGEKKPDTGQIDFIAPGRVNDSPSQDLLWSFVIHPMTGMVTSSSTTGSNGSSGTGSGSGFNGGGNRGGLGGANRQNNQLTVTEVQAAAPAVLAGKTLLVAAKDGSLLAFDNDQGVDLTAPDVKMVWPNSGEQVSGQPPLELIFKIQDEASGLDIRSLNITVDGKPFTFTFGKDGYATVRISTIGKNKPLQNGRRKIVVSAIDWLGNKADTEFSIFVDNGLKPLVRPGSENDTSKTRGRGGSFGGGAGGMGGGGGGFGN